MNPEEELNLRREVRATVFRLARAHREAAPGMSLAGEFAAVQARLAALGCPDPERTLCRWRMEDEAAFDLAALVHERGQIERGLVFHAPAAQGALGVGAAERGQSSLHCGKFSRQRHARGRLTVRTRQPKHGGAHLAAQVEFFLGIHGRVGRLRQSATHLVSAKNCKEDQSTPSG